MIMEKTLIVGTAGHVDHGKTSLIRALTGIETDRLEEERRRGITIDLGFAHFETSSTSGLTCKISFVDVPGHRSFLHNMLAGIGGVDAFLLVIAGDESVKPQTREHLNICSQLGLTRGLAVITKSDLIDDARLKLVRHEVRVLLDSTFSSSSHIAITDVSAITRQGLDKVISHLCLLTESIPAKDKNELCRLPIDRSFTIKGHGTVVTGTLISGEIETGQTLSLEPSNRSVRVRRLQVHSRDCTTVSAPSRLAVNLAGIQSTEIERGNTLVTPGNFPSLSMMDAEITLLKACLPLKHRSQVHFHCQSADTVASVTLYEGPTIEPGETKLARLKLSDQVWLLPGDRFIIRQFSPIETIGGGRVLDAHPLVRINKSQTRTWLSRLRNSPDRAAALHLFVERRRIDCLALDEACRELGVRLESIPKLIESAEFRSHTKLIEEYGFINAEVYNDAMMRLRDKIQSVKVKGSFESGIRRAELKDQMGIPEAIVTHMITELAVNREVDVRGDRICPSGFEFQLNAVDAQRLKVIENSFRTSGLVLKTVKESVENLRLTSQDVHKLVTLLIRKKTLIAIQGDLYLHQEAVAKLIADIKLLKNQELDVTRFKTITGLSRKSAIPLLEYLDRTLITRRRGDVRIVL
jgi:selenocysteine-specific elongation factor